MKLISGIVDSGFFAQSALSAEVATKDSLGRNISETYLTAVDIPESANWNSTYNTVHDNSGSWTGGGVTGDFTLVEGNGIQLTDDPIAKTTTISVSGDYATVEDVESATSGIPTIGTAEYDGEFVSVHTINNLPIWSNYSNWADAADRANEAKRDSTNRAISALPDSATVNSMISSSITGKADTSALTAYAKNWQLGELEDVVDTKLDSTAFSTVSANFYTTANESGFVTSGELPDPITIGVQEGETLDTDYDGLKIVKATANGNEHINLHKKSTDQWLIHGNLVPTSPGSNKYLVTDDSGAMHWDNTSALAYDSAFEQSGGYITAYNGSAFKAGDETVLWEGTPQYTGTLTATESVLNFDHYKVYISERERGTPSVLEFHTENTATSGNNVNTGNGGFKAIALTMFQNSNKDFFSINSNHAVWNDSFTELSLSTTGWNKYVPWNASGFSQWVNTNYTPTIRIHKIVGINRKV